jgi:chloramphenicol-sensitive protein RarD
MSPAFRLGFPAALCAFVIWGLLPLYFRALSHMAPQEMLAHRIVWSVPTGLVLLAMASQWTALRAALTWRRLGWLGLSSLLLGMNWFIYIWAVGQGRVMEGSLGYFINPLVAVLIGVGFLGEKLHRLQALAVLIAALGVIIMAVALGHVPWVSFALCATWAPYALIRKQVQIDSRAGFTIEAAFLFPIAAAWLWSFASAPGGRWFGEGGADILLLLASGPITAVPLILFAIGAKRLNMSTIGIMQYVGPTLQFMVALFLGEKFGWVHAAGFACIWLAIALFTAEGLRAQKTPALQG